MKDYKTIIKDCFSTKEKCLYIALIICGFFYCGLALTPSSYSITLDKLKSDELQSFGFPRGIRSDEFALITPLFQITVNNHFERYNQTSPYNEDLRAFVILPLKDWALVFKPANWLFLVAPPEYAYSFYYYLYFALFMVGYYRLFQKMGFNKSYSLLAATIAFTCSFTQHWYTTLVGQLSLFPWVIIAWQMQYRKIKCLVLFYAFSVFLFSSIYTPGILPLAYAGLFIIAAFFRKSVTLPNILCGLISGITAIGIFYVYNKAAIPVISNTIYPGERIVQAGTMDKRILLEYLFPYLPFVYGKHLIGDNICEISTFSSNLAVIILFFSTNLSEIKSVLIKHKALYLLIGSIVFLLIWMLFPVPLEVTKLFYLHKINPERWLFALGLLWFILLLYIFSQLSYEISNKRILCLSIFLMCVAIPVKSLWMSGNPHALMLAFFSCYDYVIAIFILFLRDNVFKKHREKSPIILLSAVALSSLMSFGFFNPWQSAKPIFSPPRTEYYKSMVSNPENYTAEGYYIGPSFGFGVTNNGLGLKSIAHTQMVPYFEFYNKYLADYLPKEDIQYLFNRYTHIVLYDKGEEIKRKLFPYTFNTGTEQWTIYGPSRSQIGYTDVLMLPRELFQKNHNQ